MNAAIEMNEEEADKYRLAREEAEAIMALEFYFRSELHYIGPNLDYYTFYGQSPADPNILIPHALRSIGGYQFQLISSSGKTYCEYWDDDGNSIDATKSTKGFALGSQQLQEIFGGKPYMYTPRHLPELLYLYDEGFEPWVSDGCAAAYYDRLQEIRRAATSKLWCFGFGLW